MSAGALLVEDGGWGFLLGGRWGKVSGEKGRDWAGALREMKPSSQRALGPAKPTGPVIGKGPS